jgi:hypothetical protein
MADTFVAITDGAGTNLHTFSRSVAGQTVHDEVKLLAMPPKIGVSGDPLNMGTSAQSRELGVPAQAGLTMPWPFCFFRVPQPYYGYLLAIEFIQGPDPGNPAAFSSTTDTIGFELGYITDGPNEAFMGTVFGTDLPVMDTGDTYPSEAWFDCGPIDASQVPTWRRLGSAHFNFSIQLSTTLPDERQKVRWAPRKPIRIGPGPSIALALFQKDFYNGNIATNWATLHVNAEWTLDTI